MHELSIAMSLVDAVCEELPKLAPCARLRAIHLRIGVLTSIVPAALQFSFEVAAAGSAIEGVQLAIEYVAASARCPRCQDVHALASPPMLICAVCGASTPDVVTGREFELTGLEVVDGSTDRRSTSLAAQEE